MGLRKGEGECVMADGSVYVGSWKQDKRCGQGTLRRAAGGYSYKGGFKDDMAEGEGELCLLCMHLQL